MDSPIGRSGQSQPLSYSPASEPGSHRSGRRGNHQVTAVCADSSLLLTPFAATGTLETVTGLTPVASHLGRLLPACDLFNLRHSLAANGWARAEIKRQAIIQCQTQEEVLLIQAIHCLSCPLEKDDKDLRADLHDVQSMQAFFQREIAPRYGAGGLPLPNPAKDKPLVFVLKCQALGKIARQQQKLCACCIALLLRRAVETGCVPVAFKMLKGLQQARQQGLLVPASLESDKGLTLLQEPGLYRKSSALWLRLVLASALFDVNPEKGAAPLLTAIFWHDNSDGTAALLAAGADPNRGGRLGTPLTLCCHNGVQNHLSKMRLLLNHSAIDPDSCCGHGGSTLHWAVANNDTRAVTQLLAHPGTNPDALNLEGYGYALHSRVDHWIFCLF